VTYVAAKARIVGERKLKETKVKGAKAKGRLVVNRALLKPRSVVHLALLSAVRLSPYHEARR
jgi:hypothetical protein